MARRFMAEVSRALPASRERESVARFMCCIPQIHCSRLFVSRVFGAERDSLSYLGLVSSLRKRLDIRRLYVVYQAWGHDSRNVLRGERGRAWTACKVRKILQLIGHWHSPRLISARREGKLTSHAQLTRFIAFPVWKWPDVNYDCNGALAP